MLIPETGAGLPNANSYASIEQADSYFALRGIAEWADLGVDEKTAALVRASFGLDAKYRGKWIGQKHTATQALAWPRAVKLGENTMLTDADGAPIPVDAIPVPILYATCEVAMIESTERFLSQGVSRDDMIKSEKVDVLETTWFDGASKLAIKRYPHIDSMLFGYATSDGAVTIGFDIALSQREINNQNEDYNPFADERYFIQG